MNFVDFLFSFFSLIAIIASICVITFRNTVIAAMQLILVFINVSMIWMLLGAEFLSLILILVYVGAVMVMFLFVVMMIDIHNIKNNASNSYMLFAFAIGLVLILESAIVLCATWNHNSYQSINDSYMTNSFSIGYALYSDYLLFIELSGVILLVGMISAIVLTLRNRKDKKPSNIDIALETDSSSRLVVVKFPKNINNYYANVVSSKVGKE